MKVIGIAGKAGAGKSTVAGMLAGMLVEAGFRVTLDAFAVEVKAMARKFWSWRGEKDAEGRALLQHVGSIGRDGWGADYWVEMLADAHETATVDYLIISDVRYLNEVRYVRAQGVLWIVTGRGGLLGEAGRHASEMAIDEIERNPADTEFINNCQMEVLADRVRQAVRDGRHDRDLM